MKRFVSCFLCFIVVLSFAGCNSGETKEKLTSGTYYMLGDFEEGLTPYVSLSLDDHTFRMGAGSLVSFQAYGSFEINGNKLIATSQITTFVLEIKDSKTLVLVDNGDNEYFQPAENSQFVYSDKMQ